MLCYEGEHAGCAARDEARCYTKCSAAAQCDADESIGVWGRV